MTPATISLLISLWIPSYANYFDKTWEMPDFHQMQSALPNRGGVYCGPSAASNGLVWLAEHGFPNLFDQSTQLDMVADLGSSEYMNTEANGGTGPVRMLDGLTKYVRDSGYLIKRIEYQGMRRSVVGWGQVKRAPPSVDWMMRGLEGDSLVLLGVGWYSKQRGEYVRNSGHWVTLAGYRRLKGRSTVYITDPSGRSERVHGDDAVERIPLVPSDCTVVVNGMEFSASDCRMLSGIRVNRSRGDVGILDSVIVLEVEKAPAFDPVWPFIGP